MTMHCRHLQAGKISHLIYLSMTASLIVLFFLITALSRIFNANKTKQFSKTVSSSGFPVFRTSLCIVTDIWLLASLGGCIGRHVSWCYCGFLYRELSDISGHSIIFLRWGLGNFQKIVVCSKNCCKKNYVWGRAMGKKIEQMHSTNMHSGIVLYVTLKMLLHINLFRKFPPKNIIHNQKARKNLLPQKTA